MDLNHGPSGYEPDELPDCSTPRRLMQYSPDSVTLAIFFQESPLMLVWADFEAISILEYRGKSTPFLARQLGPTV